VKLNPIELFKTGTTRLLLIFSDNYESWLFIAVTKCLAFAWTSELRLTAWSSYYWSLDL